jgi:hypothetical protein
VDDRVDDARRVEEQLHQQRDAPDEREPDVEDVLDVEGPEDVADGHGRQRSGVEGPGDERSADVPDPAQDRERHGEDGGEDVEAAGDEDAGVAEEQERATDGGDHAGDGERVQLRDGHMDAERGRSTLVGPDGQQSPAGASAPQVRDEDSHQEQDDHHQDHVAARVEDRVDVDPEHAQRPHADAHDAAVEVAVGQDHAVDGHAEAQGGDRQGGPPGPEGRQPDEDPDRDDRERGDRQSEQERDAEVLHALRGDEAPETGHRHLRQGQLARVARDHHLGQGYERYRGQHDGPEHQAVVEDRVAEHDDQDGREHDR